jgi:hypothetical protein
VLCCLHVNRPQAQSEVLNMDFFHQYEYKFMWCNCGVINHKYYERLVCDLCHNVQHFYSTIFNQSANCCGHFKLIWTFNQSQFSIEQWSPCAAVFITLYTLSCITHKISHPHCCKLAEVVTLSSPPFNVELSVWLPSSCKATLLIANLWHNWKKWPSVSPSDSTG